MTCVSSRAVEDLLDNDLCLTFQDGVRLAFSHIDRYIYPKCSMYYGLKYMIPVVTITGWDE